MGICKRQEAEQGRAGKVKARIAVGIDPDVADGQEGSGSRTKELVTNACWVLAEVLHAMAIVAIVMAVVRHIGNRLDRSWLGERPFRLF